MNPHVGSVLAGFHYIHRRRRLLEVITLDLFVVILGGATTACCQSMPGISSPLDRSVSACCGRHPLSAH